MSVAASLAIMLCGTFWLGEHGHPKWEIFVVSVFMLEEIGNLLKAYIGDE